MSTLLPFRALRPRPELAARICELPYDVMSSAEARQMAHGNPLSFLHVSKPEIDLGPSLPTHDPSVYAKGRENFLALIAAGSLRQDDVPAYHLYRQQMGAHTQVGLVAVASCEEYDRNIIRRHELTRPDKEDDRVRHIETLNAQTGPAFLVYRAEPELDTLIASRIKGTPDMDFTAADDIRHTAWGLRDPADLAFIRARFAAMPCLYIADGHHRSAAAARIWKSRGRGAVESVPSASFLAVSFPHNQVRILPYNRLVRDLCGRNAGDFLRALSALGHVEKTVNGTPRGKHEMALFLEGAWHSFHWKKEIVTAEKLADQLDVALLQRHVLAPLLDIQDPRTSTRISFVGGVRGTEELEREVRGGKWQIAFSMHPTDITDLMAIADANGLMPPKSTWFEPKLRDGVFGHMLENAKS